MGGRQILTGTVEENRQAFDAAGEAFATLWPKLDEELTISKSLPGIWRSTLTRESQCQYRRHQHESSHLSSNCRFATFTYDGVFPRRRLDVG
jgi:hypothetical protein